MSNKNIDNYSGSSVKNSNNGKLNQEQLIARYETVLESRENQITDLAIEIGNLNEKISNISEKLSVYERENIYLKERLSKRVKIFFTIKGSYVKSRAIK